MNVRSKYSSHRLLCLLLATALLLIVDCGTTIGIEIPEGASPAFKLIGSQDVSWLTLSGPYPTRPTIPTKENTPQIWMVMPVNANPSLDEVPLIAYGTIPSGWRQEIPRSGSPPSLIDGGMYCASVVSTRNLSAGKCFIIHDGKASNYRDKLWWR